MSQQGGKNIEAKIDVALHSFAFESFLSPPVFVQSRVQYREAVVLNLFEFWTPSGKSTCLKGPLTHRENAVIRKQFLTIIII